MNKVKKILMMVLSLVLVAAMSVGGTVAYLQDADDDVNVMTLGNVDIVQHEYQRVVNDDGTFATKTIDNVDSYVLEAFEQGKALLPSAINTTTWEGWDWDTTTVVRMTQVGSYGGMQVFKKDSNAQDKFVVVKNTGKTDAYIRTLVAIEIGSADADLIGTSYHQTWTKNEVGTIVVDGNTYFVYEYVYNGANGTRHDNGILPAGDTAYPNLSQVYIHSRATNEDMEDLDGNNNGTLDILVLSQAVQAAGFADAATALKAGFGEANAANVAEWFGGVAVIPTRNPGGTFNVTTTEEAQAALDAAEDGTVINLAAGEYGTLVFRQTASSSIVDITNQGGDAAGNEKYRKIKNLTINGADGAIVDGFAFPRLEDGVYSYIDIKNWTVNNVTFSAAQTPFVFEGTTQLGIDGLTIVNCKMTDETWRDSEVRLVYQGLAGYTELNDKSSHEYVMTAGVKNLTITGCEVDGAHQVIETRQMENLTITNNTFKHIESRDMMIGAASGKGSYTGTITITGNKSTYGEERFIRGTGIGNATLVIKDNVISVYGGTDLDYIKVEGATGAREVSNNIAANDLTVNIP